MPVYFITYLLLFWLPVLVLSVVILPTSSPLVKKAFWLNWLFFVILTSVMELIFIHFHVWNFSQQVDPLLGINFLGIPIEEFEFWWGAAGLFMLLYLAFARRFCKEA